MWLAAVLLCIVSCSKEEVTEKVIEVPEGKVLVETEIVVDGVIQSKTRASSDAGSTTGDGLYDEGDDVTVAATANEGYELVKFYDKSGDAKYQDQSSYTFKAKIPQTFKAEFARKYTITVSASPTAGGTVSGGGTYRSGKPCTLTATPNAGYTFDGWYEGSTKLSSNTSYSFTVSSNRTITGKFAAPIIIEINDREQKTNGFNRIFSRQIICSGHNISLELNTIVTYWSSYNKDYTFKTGDQSKEVLRWDYNNSWGPNDEPIEEDIRIEFVSFSLMIDGVKIISKETYTSKSTNDLYYDQVQMNGREFSVNGKVYKLQVNRDLY